MLADKERKDYKSFSSNTKLIASDSDIEKHLNLCSKALWQKKKNYSHENWSVLDIIVKHAIKVSECA